MVLYSAIFRYFKHLLRQLTQPVLQQLPAHAQRLNLSQRGGSYLTLWIHLSHLHLQISQLSRLRLALRPQLAACVALLHDLPHNDIDDRSVPVSIAGPISALVVSKVELHWPLR